MDSEVAQWADEASNLLDAYKLNDAEVVLHNIITNTRTDTPNGEKYIIMALQGLAEIFSKRGRVARGNDMEWHWMYIEAITMLRLSLEHCENAQKDCDDNQLSLWLQQSQKKGKTKLRTLQDALIQSLQRHLVPVKTGQIERKHVKHKEENHDQWLKKLRTYCSEKVKKGEDKIDEKLLADIEEEKDGSESQEAESDSSEKTKSEKPKEKMNFDKVQHTIKKLVRQISFDLKQRQYHGQYGHLFHAASMESLCQQFESEAGNVAERLTGSCIDLRNTGTTPSEEEKLSPKETMNQGSKYDELSPMSETSDKWDEDPDKDYSILEQFAKEFAARRAAEIEKAEAEKVAAEHARHEAMKAKKKQMSFKAVPLDDSTVQLGSIKTSELLRYVSQDEEEEEYMENTGSILRIWQGYKKEPHESTLAPHKLETFEELSPITEAFKPFPSRPSVEPIPEEDETVDDQNKCFKGSLVTETNIGATLGEALYKLGDKCKKDGKLNEARDLYKYSLGIYQDISETEPQTKHMAYVLKNIGVIKCTQGDVVGGSRLMERSMELYKQTAEPDSSRCVAEVWYELGIAFMAEQLAESSQFDHVMKTVQEEVQQEVRANTDADDETSDDESEEGESYFVSIYEAISCFSQSADIMRQLRNNTKLTDEANALFAEVLAKLGDCSIMVGDYDRAVLCYEEALYLFKNTFGQSSALPNNAHVLTMMGTANYLLCNYPKAVSMFECAHLFQQHLHGTDNATFEMAFTLTMIGVTFYTMQQYHKSIAWCLRAFELYTILYKEDIILIDTQRKWFVTLTLYMLGFAYGTISFHDKALHYLELSRAILISEEEDTDIRQLVKILKAMADVYTALEDNENALKYYNEAFELNMSIGTEKASGVLQNQLLNRMAGVHVSTKQYDTAAMYLEKALDFQKNVESDIKDDLVMVLYQLGVTYTLAGDIDKAIDCYVECLDSFRETGQTSVEMARTFGRLGTLYHVKACIQEEYEEMDRLLLLAEDHFKEAITLDKSHCSAILGMFANYYCHQGEYGEALCLILPLFSQTKHVEELTYHGLEQAVLPETLQQEFDDQEDGKLDFLCFVKYLGILCYKQLNLMRDCDDLLVNFFKDVINSSVPQHHSFLGYALMEVGLYYEAAESFGRAATLEHDNNIALGNCCICLGLWLYLTVLRAAMALLQRFQVGVTKVDYLKPMLTVQTVMYTPDQDYLPSQPRPSVRDSGYYDHGLEDQEEKFETWESSRAFGLPPQPPSPEPEQESFQVWETSEEVVETPAAVLEMLAQHRGESTSSLADRGYTSNEQLEQEDYNAEPPVEEEEKWETIEETVSTPLAILEMMKQQQEEREQSVTPTAEMTFTFNQPLSDQSNTRTSYHDNISAEETFTLTQPYSEKNSPEESWHTEETVVETPYEVLQAIRNGQNYDSQDYVEFTMNTQEEEPAETWVTEEAESETPLAILQHLKALEESEARIKASGITADMPMSIMQHVHALSEDFTYNLGGDSTEEEKQEEEWVTEEETVETPSAVLDVINKNETLTESSNLSRWDQDRYGYRSWRDNDRASTASRSYQYSDSYPKHESTDRGIYDTWRTTEETVVTSPSILQAVKQNGHMTSMDQSQSNQFEEEQEQWETIEETVETPPEVLAMLMRQQRGY